MCVNCATKWEGRTKLSVGCNCVTVWFVLVPNKDDISSLTLKQRQKKKKREEEERERRERWRGRIEKETEMKLCLGRQLGRRSTRRRLGPTRLSFQREKAFESGRLAFEWRLQRVNRVREGGRIDFEQNVRLLMVKSIVKTTSNWSNMNSDDRSDGCWPRRHHRHQGCRPPPSRPPSRPPAPFFNFFSIVCLFA